MSDEVALLERLAFEAWPAAEVEALDGWRLRSNRGVTNRASSVWPCAATGRLSLDARIARVEAFYAERGAGALYQISPAAQPPGLDAALAERGYERRSPVEIRTAETASVAARPVPTAVETEVSDVLSTDWFQLSGHRGRFSGAQVPVYRALLGRVRERPAFALARVGGEPVGVGLGVSQAGWMGIFAMLTLPRHRGRGVGRAILHALATRALQRGDQHLYLQVETANEVARSLYTATGFRPRYPYHYRAAPTPDTT